MATKPVLCPTLILNDFKSYLLYSAQYHRQHCTLQAFEPFGALYMHTTTTNIRPDRDSNLVPPGYKPSRYEWAIGAGPWFLKREKLKTLPLYSLVTKNQASVWNSEEDMMTFVMMLWRPFWFFYDTYSDVVRGIVCLPHPLIPKTFWWNKLVSISIIDEYMLTSVISWRPFWICMIIMSNKCIVCFIACIDSEKIWLGEIIPT